MKTQLFSRLACQPRSRFLVTALFPVICALSSIGETSAAITLFQDTFDRTAGDNLNGFVAGKSGTLSPLNWNERVTNGVATDDVDILANRMGMQAGTTTTSGGVAYVDHNFIGYTSITVAFDYAIAPTAGSVRQLGFGIGNTKSTLDALTSSGAFGVIGISFDLATSIANSTPETGIQIFHGGSQQTFIPRTVLANDTLSATFSFANMNAGTTINYEVFHEGNSIHMGSHAWAATDTNYIGMFNTHRNTDSDVISIDNFVVSTIPEPKAALLGCVGVLLLLRRRR